LQSQKGDWEAVVHAKRSLVPRADANEKFRNLDEIGDIYKEKLSNPQKSIAAYLEALEIQPSHHTTLQKLIDIYPENEQWKKAVEVLQRLVEIETDPLIRGYYHYVAGVFTRDKLKSLDDAVDWFGRALDEYFAAYDRINQDDLPKYLKAFE